MCRIFGEQHGIGCRRAIAAAINYRNLRRQPLPRSRTSPADRHAPALLVPHLCADEAQEEKPGFAVLQHLAVKDEFAGGLRAGRKGAESVEVGLRHHHRDVAELRFVAIARHAPD